MFWLRNKNDIFNFILFIWIFSSLQVQYTVCDIRKQKTDIFCDEGRINVKIHSCGTVYVMHWPYPAGEEKGNRFLLSYNGMV